MGVAEKIEAKIYRNSLQEIYLFSGFKLRIGERIKNICEIVKLQKIKYELKEFGPRCTRLAS